MTASEFEPAAWRKSTRSADNGACVEIANSVGVVGMRDSKDPTGPVLVFEAASWRAFASGLRNGGLARP